MNTSSLELLEARCKTSMEEKLELEKRISSLRTEFDMERKSRQELGAKNSEFESELLELGYSGLGSIDYPEPRECSWIMRECSWIMRV